ncbi:helix-turn-helix transcriptional regulator [Marinobacterium arenosum]|uniref:helix-turn-helix transcriptional regulator n=1 Tax=Marinobacterium arenosum TaxID=2862496 RepID=UPI001C94C6D5|nr:AraC family transcriptional regulator [Marinobacterium arenosum]MBY4676265.1 AraC family transcriptional regulator [Marinobacterium arenosum]
MQKPDRLSSLLNRFELQASALTDRGDPSANLLLLGQPEGGLIEQVLFWPAGVPATDAPTSGPEGKHLVEVITAAVVSLGGDSNPMARALPARISMPVAPDSMVNELAQLIARETQVPRCGGRSTLQRLLEVLVIMLLRHTIEQGSSQPGLIAGLADPRISRALVAIHEAPQRAWRSEQLADIAGLSRSQFMARFGELVGQTPFSYLRQWRLTLARQELAAGARVKAVAARYGYSSPEALSRAYSQAFGESPIKAKAG